MAPVDFVAFLVILVIVGLAVAYIVREKRRGVVCVGCAVGKSCAEKRNAQKAGACTCDAATKMVEDLEEALRK